ncbi:hypothetical protein AB5I39_10195 [Sphingomonas sp. MMS24-J45]|uniref:beta strand repeat-containing protein n=1 Tax=Sphingomonas sp. MMS24-J45 TaxID=3238806 RepID=UPI00384DBDA5
MTSIRNRKHGNSVRAAGAVKRFGLVSTTALVPVMTALASAAMLLTPTAAHAQNGGDGGNNPGSGGIRSLLGPGSNGIGTPLSGGGGGAGATGGTGGGGGGSGGASAGTNGNGGVAAGSGGGGGAHGTLSATLPAIATIGGSGGAGAPAASGVNRGGGGGGAGGFGAVVTGGGNLGILTVNLSGGTGGAGGGGANGSYGGDGGSGGNGLVLTGNGTTVSIDSAVTGGNGGSGGSVGTAGGGTAGRGGTGGVGLQILGVNSVVTIGASGSVVGGNGGAALGGAGQGGGDAGITGGNLSLIVGGLVRGGTGIFGRADAVTFTGGTNVLEVLAGATFIGNVSANSGADTLRLGGAGNGTFDVSNIGSGRQFRNFGVFEKNGTSVWTLTGTSTAATPWAINGGTLSIATDGSLGAAGSMRFNGGALATTASFGTTRNVTLNAGGGTFAPAAGTTLTWSGNIAGSGALTKADTGTLTLSGNSSYAGLTTISAGTLVAASNNALGSSAGGTLVQDGATLIINGGVTNAEAITINGTGVGGLGALRVGATGSAAVGSVALGSDATINLGSSDSQLQYGSFLGGGHALTAIGDGTLLGPISNISSFTADGPRVRLYQANVAAPVFVKSGFLYVGIGSVTDQTRINLAAGTTLFALGGDDRFGQRPGGIGPVSVHDPDGRRRRYVVCSQ